LSLKSSAFQLPDGDKLTGEYFASDGELDAFITKNIGEVNGIESSLGTDISLGSPTNLPLGYGYSTRSNFILDNQGARVGGVTTPVKGTGYFEKLKSLVHISPAIKGQFYSGVNAARMIIRHELLHAFHNSMGFAVRPNFVNHSEYAANAYSLAYSKINNMVTPLNYARKLWGNYPSIYSWRVLSKQFPKINMGIK